MRWVLKHLKNFLQATKRATLSTSARRLACAKPAASVVNSKSTNANCSKASRFHDTVAQGVYPVDIHNPDGPGITFRHLDGTEHTIAGDGSTLQHGRWDGLAADAPLRDTPCYSIPYRAR